MNKSYRCLLLEWGRLLAAVRASEVDFPVLTAYRITLENHLENVKAAKARQLTLQANYQQASGELRQMLRTGSDEVLRLRSQVKAVLGPRNPKLRLFGVTPIRKRGPYRKRPATLVCIAPAG